MSGNKNLDYVHSLSKKGNIDNGLSSMLGEQNMSGSIQQINNNNNNVQREVSVSTNAISQSINVIETSIKERVVTFQYEIENNGEQPVNVVLDFSGSFNVKFLEPVEFSQTMKCTTYCDPGTKSKAAILRQHLSTQAARISYNSEIKTTLKEYEGANDWGMFNKQMGGFRQVSNAPVNNAPSAAEINDKIQDLDDLYSSIRRLINISGAQNLKEARKLLEDADPIITWLKSNSPTSTTRQKATQYNNLSKAIRDAETALATGSNNSININEILSSESVSSDSLLDKLNSIQSRLDSLTASNVHTMANKLMADLKSVKADIQSAQQSGWSPNLSQCVQKYNGLSKTVPATINDLFKSNPIKGPVTTQKIAVGTRNGGFTVDPRTGKKKYHA
eukprot:TRINITY_DN7079_c0_g1_i1.p1 TRINITY_DN7079_c0_g1~~TRINITY_DN7079_c0_g1_i1.p1  ORF type:complete len:399 (+),score=133.40 TRINITY_DN7079_c0_g1_i1:29-1198(+)